MNVLIIFKALPFLGLILALSACGGGSDNGPMPDEIRINATTEYSLHEGGAFYEVHIKKGEEFNLDIAASFSPYHPDVQLTYDWTKAVYEKSLPELMAENDNNLFTVLAIVDADVDFKEGETITELADWDLTATGYVQYSIKIGAEGYYMEYIPMTSVSQAPSASKNHLFVRVYLDNEVAL